MAGPAAATAALGGHAHPPRDGPRASAADRAARRRPRAPRDRGPARGVYHWRVPATSGARSGSRSYSVLLVGPTRRAPTAPSRRASPPTTPAPSRWRRTPSSRARRPTPSARRRRAAAARRTTRSGWATSTSTRTRRRSTRAARRCACRPGPPCSTPRCTGREHRRLLRRSPLVLERLLEVRGQLSPVQRHGEVVALAELGNRACAGGRAARTVSMPSAIVSRRIAAPQLDDRPRQRAVGRAASRRCRRSSCRSSATSTGNCLQVAQRRVAGAEVVDGDRQRRGP